MAKRTWCLLLLALVLMGCARETKPSPGVPVDTQTVVMERAKEAAQALKASDMKRLSLMVHPDKGVRFSPYGHVRAEASGDRVLTPDQILGALTDTKVYHWGIRDGSGNPIDLTNAEYLRTFVNDKDFTSAPRSAYNEIIGKGNTSINLNEVYPDGKFVEYHFPGTDQFGGMDWKSLRLVFEVKNQVWYLVGVIHDQWTI